MIRAGALRQPTLAASELRLCLSLNRFGARPRVRAWFGAVSRLGDGVAWYALMLVLPLCDGLDGLRASLHLALLGLVALGLYRGLKRYTRRPRPYARYHAIAAHVAALDEFSFPSGHTLHAVGFSVVTLHYYPLLAPLLLPFTLMIALSRVVLGLHYPSDVLAATVIGVALARCSIALVA